MRAIIIRRAPLVCYGVSYARTPGQFRTIQPRQGMGEPSIGILKFDTSEQWNRRAGPGHTNFDIAIEVVAINRCVYFSNRNDTAVTQWGLPVAAYRQACGRLGRVWIWKKSILFWVDADAIIDPLVSVMLSLAHSVLHRHFLRMSAISLRLSFELFPMLVINDAREHHLPAPASDDVRISEPAQPTALAKQSGW
jgi:hypothetical protein